jgi:predicted RNA binding protein YcfA (HicA-like mRNA interferase family)
LCVRTSYPDCPEGYSRIEASRVVEDRQKGSHLILIHPSKKARTVIPVHGSRRIKKPLLRAIIRDANLSVEEFVALL